MAPSRAMVPRYWNLWGSRTGPLATDLLICLRQRPCGWQHRRLVHDAEPASDLVFVQTDSDNR